MPSQKATAVSEVSGLPTHSVETHNTEVKLNATTMDFHKHGKICF